MAIPVNITHNQIIMIQTLRFIFCLAIIILLQGCAGAPKRTGAYDQDGRFQTTPFLGTLIAKRATLDNGLKVILVEDRSSPTLAFQTWYRVGSRHEQPGRTGLAHLFEHMMFKGTTEHPEGQFDSLMERAGVQGINAFTSHDHTVYLQEAPNQELVLLLNLESDRMKNLVVNDHSFGTEREVVKNERRFRNDNNPEGQLMQALFEQLYSAHPYRWPIIGYEQDLNIMGAQDARNFYEQFYSPDRATIVIVGDIDAESTLRRIESYYGKIPARGTPDPVVQAEPAQTAQRRKRLTLNVESEKLWMAFRTPEGTAESMQHLELIQTLLTDGNHSRLKRALVDSGVASEVECGSFDLQDSGSFLITASLQRGKTTRTAETLILRELERLKQSLVAPLELARAKNVFLFKTYGSLNSAQGKAQYLGASETLYGDLIQGLNRLDLTQQITPEQIRDTARLIFKTESMTMLIGSPTRSNEGAL